MNKRIAFTVFCIFCFFYLLNCLTPMAFGDDYVYSFIWQGQSEFEPLSENATRVSSFRDIFVSQLSHYLTWSGRAVSHVIAQFFLWTGKDIFNLFNALISVLLIAEIYWCANRGMVTLNLQLKRFCLIFFMLWAFSPGFSPVFFWLSGACNYLWSAVLLLGFLLPYVRKYYYFENRIFPGGYFSFLMFFLGILAGWTNENSICWIIAALSFFVFINRSRSETEAWMLAGLAGLVIGYGLLMLAPGNVARLHTEVGQGNHWLNLPLIKRNLDMLLIVFTWQFLLWYFNFRSLFLLSGSVIEKFNLEKDKCLIKLLCAISFCMTGAMVLSPNFPPRSSFPGTVQLIVASCILLRLQQDCPIVLIKQQARRFLFAVGAVYFAISAVVTIYGSYDYYVQVKNMLLRVKSRDRQEIITVNSLIPVSETVANLSGLHLLFYKMSADENDWRNVAFARYYGIKGIRMIELPEKQE